MIFLRYVILFVLFLSTGSSLRSLDWCAYWRALHQDHLRPECNGIYRIRFSRIRAAPTIETSVPELRGDFLNGFHRYRAEVTGVNSLTKRVLGIDECASSYSFCRSSTICESGAVCLSDSGYCCARATVKPSYQPPQCPLPSQLFVNCRATMNFNWCTAESQCGHGKHCCPSLCGYNVCF